MYATGLGQPRLTPGVLSFIDSPQLSAEFAAWLDYWADQVPARFAAATTELEARQAASALLNAMVTDIYAQGGSDELAQFVQLGIGASLANVAFENWKGGSYPLPQYTPPPPADPNPCQNTPESIAMLRTRLQNFEASLPLLTLYAEQGQPGAAETLAVVLRDIASITEQLARCGEAPGPALPPTQGPQAPAGSDEVYIINGIRITVPAGTGPTTAARMVSEGCVDAAIKSCEVTQGSSPPPPTTSNGAGPAPSNVPLLAGAGLLALLFLAPTMKTRR